MTLSDIKRVGVVGGGTMGFGIAINFALAGYPTFISDLSDEILDRSMERIRSAMTLFVEEKLIHKDQADETVNRIVASTDLTELAAHSDFITESIVERLKDKQVLFSNLDRLCPPHTIIVSNTSRLVLSDIGAEIKRQDKIGLTHYFAPPHIVPGVEVARGPGMSDDAYNIVYELIKKIGKVPIRVAKELPGYLLNRIQAAMSREANRLWAEGVATAEDIELGVTSTFGFRMPHEGPMGHYDLAGIWQWPADARSPQQTRQEADLLDETAQKIRERMAEGRPWFVDPEQFDAAIEKRDREYIRRLKTLYRPRRAL